jgi:hypothetical protein
MRSRISMSVLALTAAACTGGPATALPTAGPTAGAAQPTPSPVVIATTSPTPTPAPTPEVTEAGCPTVTPMTIIAFWNGVEEAACFDDEDIEIQGWIDAPVGIGFEPTWIEPKWLSFPVFDWALWSLPPGPDQDCGGAEPCTSMFAFLNPDSGVLFEGPPRWVIVTGHLNDPASATCHYASDPPRTFTAEDDARARETCAERFVLTAVREAP